MRTLAERVPLDELLGSTVETLGAPFREPLPMGSLETTLTPMNTPITKLEHIDKVPTGFGVYIWFLVVRDTLVPVYAGRAKSACGGLRDRSKKHIYESQEKQGHQSPMRLVIKACMEAGIVPQFSLAWALHTNTTLIDTTEMMLLRKYDFFANEQNNGGRRMKALLQFLNPVVDTVEPNPPTLEVKPKGSGPADAYLNDATALYDALMKETQAASSVKEIEAELESLRTKCDEAFAACRVANELYSEKRCLKRRVEFMKALQDHIELMKKIEPLEQSRDALKLELRCGRVDVDAKRTYLTQPVE